MRKAPIGTSASSDFLHLRLPAPVHVAEHTIGGAGGDAAASHAQLIKRLHCLRVLLLQACEAGPRPGLLRRDGLLVGVPQLGPYDTRANGGVASTWRLRTGGESLLPGNLTRDADRLKLADICLSPRRLPTLSGRPTFSEADVAANDGCPARLASSVRAYGIAHHRKSTR